MAREQLREEPHHHLAVLQHVGDAGGRAGIVLEDVEGALVDPHDVDAGDVDVDPVRHLEADHLRPVMRVAEDEVGRDDAGLDAFLRAVDVGEEGVERGDALLQAAFEIGPFRLGQHARDDVEGDQALGRLVVAVDREGDADAAEEQLRLAAAGVEHLGRRLVEPALEIRR